MSCSGGEDSVCTQVRSIKGDFIALQGGKKEESMISLILPGRRSPKFSKSPLRRRQGGMAGAE